MFYKIFISRGTGFYHWDSVGSLHEAKKLLAQIEAKGFKGRIEEYHPKQICR